VHQVNSFVQQLFDQAGGVRFGGETAGHTQQGLLSTMHDRHALRGNETRFDVFDAEWLGHVIVRAGLDRGQAVLRIAERGQHDEVRVRRTDTSAHALAQLYAVQPGHHPIADDDVGGLLVIRGQRLNAVARTRDRMAQAGYDILDQRSDVGVILDNEN
jgi:hypothetical protein